MMEWGGRGYDQSDMFKVMRIWLEAGGVRNAFVLHGAFFNVTNCSGEK